MSSFVAKTKTDEDGLRTLERGLTIIEVLAASGRPGLPFAELQRRLGLHRTTLHRFLATLERRGYVEQPDQTERFRLALKPLELASAVIGGLSLRDVGGPILEELQRKTHETVHIAVLEQGEVVTIDRLDAEHPIVLRTHIGARRPAHCTASGKAILAFLPDETVDAILARGMLALTPKTITDPVALKAQLRHVRADGYATDGEEFTTGIRCVAAPVFEFSGRVAGAVSLSAPCLRVDVSRLDELAGHVTDAARRLSRQLGYPAAPARPSPSTHD